MSNVITTCTIGDLSVSIYSYYSVDPAEKDNPWFAMVVLDLPSGETARMEFGNKENDAMMAMATWISQDLPNLGDLEPMRRDLKARLPEWAML